MIALTLREVADTVGGELVLAGSDVESTTVSGEVHTDSRKAGPGSIFFALPGEVTDGHLFASSAVENGAVLAIVERMLDLPVAQIVVPDGVAALADLAREVVARVRALGSLRVVAVTGSNGKTTTKNMLRAILEREGPTVAPFGSFNNHVGAPISMLAVDEQTRYLVVEMGASAIGEIASLISIVTPDVGIVLKVGLAHVGEFGGPDAVETAKSEMVTDLPESAVAALNVDDPRVARMAGKTRARVSWFGLGEGAEVRGSDIEATAEGTAFTLHVDGAERRIRLRILGEHHVMNALAAITAARALGVDAERAADALESLARAARWRMEVQPREDGVIVLNDAYNASPDSMAAALKTLAQIVRPDQRSVAVLGEMAELGDLADEEHDRIGRLAVRLNIRKLVVVGHAARHIHNAAGLEGSWDGESVLVADADEAYDVLRDELRPGDVVLVKSSGSAGLRFLGDRIAGVSE
ncbi:UDP-N-acetylmuramoyl-tripeptide--D-alanyl-D-alanine ligase [Salinibacterium soli]|uniref:UDP-N-acetylmuramoyl-tripeptide--D-alanyl-D-alanine ligase n=1 Tax=Antiquaquibacter soli TaxID=3064523 RepID=A0ABT9BMK5_9MICO|nr:UDP-N-acetylmuramoyl-tripeptide--D-alanyl-D-alanine ligase [Protaetiibacter sp. WY-16]MDO7881829.1 UDP-N-acetylmuramoyl-tripeptide--D-alanyl-D-alanine ligase [Protaetiibacter sp. WY-16]